MFNALNVQETFDPLQFYLISVRSVYGYFTTSTGGLSSSCEMIILRNKSHGEIVRVWMGILTTDVRNKKYNQILNKQKKNKKRFHPTSIPQWIACCLTAYYAEKTQISELSIFRFPTYIREAQGCTPHFRTPDLRMTLSTQLTWLPQINQSVPATQLSLVTQPPLMTELAQMAQLVCMTK